MSSFIDIRGLENHEDGIFYLMSFNPLKWGDFAFPGIDENG